MNLHVVVSLLTLNLIFEFKIFFYAEYTQTIEVRDKVNRTKSTDIVLLSLLSTLEKG